MAAAWERCITVFGLPSTADDMELRRLFAVFGPIASVQVSPERHGSQRRGLVTFRTPEAAQKAKATMQGYHHRGASIHVRLAGYIEGGSWEVAESECIGGAVKAPRTRIYDSRFTGTILLWKGMYGWVDADQRINHPTATKHQGRVFVDIQDVKGADELNVGDRVSFFVYVDSEGVGASDVRLQGGHGAYGSSSSSSAPAGGDALVLVDGWPPSLDEAALRQTFEQYGSVSSVTVKPPKKQGSRSTGHVVFASLQAAQAAVQSLDGTLYGAKPLQVVLAGGSLEEALGSQGGTSPLPSAAYLAGAAAAAAPLPPPPPRRGEDGSAAPGRPGPDAAAAPASNGDTRVMGTVKSWKQRYGWITPDRRIPQEAHEKHRGWVYADARDLENVSELRVGDRVSFVVYRDTQGIGGSQVRVESNAAPVGLGPAARAAAAAAAAAPAPKRPPRWWHELAGDCCPISLTAFEEMEYEPFGLLGNVEDADEPTVEGLWGASAIAALLSMKPVHWFDGRFLACSLVSKGQLVDPVSMRPLLREECASLDRYLAANGLPAVRVAEAFDLAQTSTAGEGGEARERLAVLGQEAASLVRIFDEEPAAGPAAPGAAAPEEPPAPAAASRRRRWGQGR